MHSNFFTFLYFLPEVYFSHFLSFHFKREQYHMKINQKHYTANKYIIKTIHQINGHYFLAQACTIEIQFLFLSMKAGLYFLSKYCTNCTEVKMKYTLLQSIYARLKLAYVLSLAFLQPISQYSCPRVTYSYCRIQ